MITYRLCPSYFCEIEELLVSWITIRKPFIASKRNKNLHQIIGGNSILKSKVVRKNNENYNQDYVHHASHDRTIFAVNKWNKQTYSKVTEQIRTLKLIMILHVKVKILYTYSSIENANYNALE